MREKLIDLLWDAFELVDNELPTVEQVADHLIANGVSVKKEKLTTDIADKCGSCVYAKYEPNKIGKIDSLVRCTNAEHLAKYPKPLRQRTTKACKQYEAKEQ